MPRGYRTPTPKEAEKLERARKLMQESIDEEQDPLTRFLPTGQASAARGMRAAKKLRESVPEAAREGEAYNQAGYANGGKVRGGGCEQRGKTRGRMV